MSNQRAGKFKPATLREGGGMQTVNFFKYAKEILESEGHEDAAFYFEQMETWLREGKALPQDSRSIAHALGV
tara:strand:- start:299 stop:514 length:216 start_codon:yes stop_codon:yes gene_type:complete